MILRRTGFLVLAMVFGCTVCGVAIADSSLLAPSYAFEEILSNVVYEKIVERVLIWCHMTQAASFSTPSSNTTPRMTFSIRA